MAAPAPAHTFSLPASHINTRMVFLPPTAVPNGTLSHPSMLPPPAPATQPPRIHFAAVTTTTTTTITSTRRRRRTSNWSDESAPVTEYFTGHTDENGRPLGRTLTPYPARKVCGVDWTSMSEISDDFEHEHAQDTQLEQMQLQLHQCESAKNTISTRRVTFAAGPTDSNSNSHNDNDNNRAFGWKLVRTPTPYPRTATNFATTTATTTATDLSANVSASTVGAEKKPFWHKYLVKLKAKLGVVGLKTSSSRSGSSSRSRGARNEGGEKKEDEDEERTPSPNSLRHERSMRAVFGEEGAVYDGGCKLMRCEARGQ